MQISLGVIGLILVIFSILIGVPNNHNALVTPTSYPITSLFSKDADKAFVSSFTGGTDLNSGITMEQARSAIPEQANNITFAVFNHTDEPILFEDQGYGITIFRYDDTHKLWETLQLQYTPYRELRTLPPKLERWDLDLNNTWSVSEDETTASGAEKLRLYISGTGQTTNKIYGAYLDVPIISFQRETAQHSVLRTGSSPSVKHDDSSCEGAPDLGYAPRFLSRFLALAESRFEGESTLPPQAGNANRGLLNN